MAVPRNRSSNARRKTRAAHMAKQAKNFTACKNCEKMRLSHRICPNCGQYANRTVNEKA